MTTRKHQKSSAEKTVRDIRRATRRSYSAEEKIRIVVEGLRGEASIAELCRREGINTNVYYRWSKEFLEAGKKRLAGDTVREATSDNEMWQTDFTYCKVVGWGWYYLSSVLDDFSRFIIAWRLCTTMSATDVSDTLDDALRFTGLDQVKVKHKPRLLSDNGPSYISGELADYLEDQHINHTRGRPYHPQTQGKIERWHRSLKNQILLDNYYLPGELEERIRRFVDYYNHERYHESLDNLTPADVYYGRGQAVLNRREKIKLETLAMRRQKHYDNRARTLNLMS